MDFESKKNLKRVEVIAFILYNEEEFKGENIKKIILDTDTYNEADDIFALSYLLKNETLFDIRAITIAPFKHSGYAKTVSDSIEDSYQ